MLLSAREFLDFQIKRRGNLCFPDALLQTIIVRQSLPFLYPLANSSKFEAKVLSHERNNTVVKVTPSSKKTVIFFDQPEKLMISI